MSVSNVAIQQATQEAARTNNPQPVRDNSGKVAYWVDPSGRKLENGTGNQPKGYHPSDPVSVTNSAGAVKNAADKAKRDADAKAAAAAKAKGSAAASAQQKAAVDSANQGYVWLDGHRVKVTAIGTDQFGNKQFTFATDADGYKKTQNYALPTAYAALDNVGSTPAASTQFLMSETSGPQVMGPFNPDGTGLQHTGRNMMTIGNALQWLANLSVKDPNSYSAMVDKLHQSGYLSDSNYVSAAGHYSQDVADAFARAASDTAVLNSTDGKSAGYHMTLTQLLDSKAGAMADAQKKARAANYQPVQRTFTDPTEIKATAKSAAQAAIGRDLTPEEEAKLEAHVKGLQSANYDAIDSAGRNGDNATITDVSVPGQAQGFLDTQDAQEEANFRSAGYGSALRNLFGLGG